MTFRRFGVSRGVSAFPAFTLVEIMVVIGILAVLVAIALPTASSLLADSRAKQTKATMKVLEAAIEQFVRDNPFGNTPNVQGHTLRLVHDAVPNADVPPTNCDVRYMLSGVLHKTDDDVTCTIHVPLFDRYPPCPLTTFALDPATPETFIGNPPIIGPPQVPPYPGTDDENPDTAYKFLRLINVMKGFDVSLTCFPTAHWFMQNDKGQQITATTQEYAESYASIECLFFALHEFSPAARKILDQLQGKPALANLDKDFAFHDVTDNSCTGSPDGTFQAQCLAEQRSQVTLYEVLDAWKRPIRYAIREAIRISLDSTAPLPAPLRWELRSAGADGVFAPPFTEESRSDDIILQGQ